MSKNINKDNEDSVEDEVTSEADEISIEAISPEVLLIAQIIQSTLNNCKPLIESLTPYMLAAAKSAIEHFNELIANDIANAENERNSLICTLLAIYLANKNASVKQNKDLNIQVFKHLELFKECFPNLENNLALPEVRSNIEKIINSVNLEALTRVYKEYNPQLIAIGYRLRHSDIKEGALWGSTNVNEKLVLNNFIHAILVAAFNNEVDISSFKTKELEIMLLIFLKKAAKPELATIYNPLLFFKPYTNKKNENTKLELKPDQEEATKPQLSQLSEIIKKLREGQ